MIWLTLRLGWRVGLRPAAPDHAPTSSASRRAPARPPGDSSGRALGRAGRVRPTCSATIFTFACVLLDRVFLLSGRLESFRIDVRGLDHLTGARRAGAAASCSARISAASRCCAPSAEVAGAGEGADVRGNAGAYSRLMDGAGPPSAGGRSSRSAAPDAMLQVRDCLRGARSSASCPTARPAPASRSPCRSSADPPCSRPARRRWRRRSECRWSCSSASAKGKRHYEVRFEPFAERITLSAEGRAADFGDWVGRYAGRLEAQCREHPYNWFNFYDFW